jgi:iron complex transport system permease protein
MSKDFSHSSAKVLTTTIVLGVLLLAVMALGLSAGSAGFNLDEILNIFFGDADPDTTTRTILFKIRLPRVILAAAVGATLALGGLVFQALLRNSLAEPYILGISGGAAIGAILGMLLGLSHFPGVSIAAFSGGLATLGLVILLAAGRTTVNRESLILSGVMVNAFCGAVIMFLISLSNSTQTHQILFWLMGDLSMFPAERMPVLLTLLPCFLLIMCLARPMNLLLMGGENAASLGVNVKRITLLLLVATSFMVSIVVCQSGLIGFVGLVIPHVLRLLLGPDHRLLTPASLLGGASFLILCDLLARTLPAQGEMPVGVITALIGAPLFIFLLWRAGR